MISLFLNFFIKNSLESSRFHYVYPQFVLIFIIVVIVTVMAIDCQKLSDQFPQVSFPESP